MSALLFIQDKRKTLDRIQLVSTLRMAFSSSQKDVEKHLSRWAKDADIELTFED